MKNLTQKIYSSYKLNSQNYNDKIKKRLASLIDTKDVIWTRRELLEDLIIAILTAIKYDKTDLLESLEQYYKGESIRIWIPIVPPGVNATYGVNCKGKQKVYKTKAAKEWEKAAIMPIRSAANSNNFLIDKEKDRLLVSILIKGSRHDVDAPIKMILDTVARTLDFDDKIIIDVRSRVKRSASDRGVLIEIEKET